MLFFGAFLPDSTRHVGAFDTQCDVVAVVNGEFDVVVVVVHVADAFENARFLCDRYYMAAPEMNIHTYAPHRPLSNKRVSSYNCDDEAETITVEPCPRISTTSCSSCSRCSTSCGE